MLPEFLRDLARLGPAQIASWIIAGGAGYWLWLWPQWYPPVAYKKAETFTPAEVAEWNERSGGKKKAS